MGDDSEEPKRKPFAAKRKEDGDDGKKAKKEKKEKDSADRADDAAQQKKLKKDKSKVTQFIFLLVMRLALQPALSCQKMAITFWEIETFRNRHGS